MAKRSLNRTEKGSITSKEKTPERRLPTLGFEFRKKIKDLLLTGNVPKDLKKLSMLAEGVPVIELLELLAVILKEKDVPRRVSKLLALPNVKDVEPRVFVPPNKTAEEQK